MMFPAASRGVNLKSALWSTLFGWLPAAHALLLPPRCLLCGAEGLRLPGYRGPIELCAPCRADLPPAEAGLKGPAGGAFELACVPWAYRWPIDAFVRALKFDGERSHARLFGGLLAAERAALGPPWPDCVVPVPLHALRLRERGYNQAALIARHAALACGRPLRAQALARVRATRAQSALGIADRRANVAGAFCASPVLAGLRVALVDDVATTGSTAAAAARALRAAGAASVELWAVARAERRVRSTASAARRMRAGTSP